MPMPEYTKTQRVDDFRVDETVIVRDCIYANGSPLNVGATYTVKEVRVENAERGSGSLVLNERQDGGFDGAFGHLLFDHFEAAAPDAPTRPFKVGDRIVQTGPHYFANGRTDYEYHESPNGIGSTGVINRVDDDRVSVVWDNPTKCADSVIATNSVALAPAEDEVKPLALDDLEIGETVRIIQNTTLHSFDDGDLVEIVNKVDPSGRGDTRGYVRASNEAHGSWAVNLNDLEKVEVAQDDTPDLSDASVRKDLPMEQAYPVGSVWNHTSSGHQPVTIVGYETVIRPAYREPREYVKVNVPEYIGQRPYSGDWIRGALDSFGTLVSLPDADVDQHDDEIEFQVGDRVMVTGAGCVVGLPAPGTIVALDDSATYWVEDLKKSIPHPFKVKIDDGHPTDVGNSGAPIGAYEVKPLKDVVLDESKDEAPDPVERLERSRDGDRGPRRQLLRDRVRVTADTGEDKAARVSELEAEINLLKQAAADERRRLCAEIDSLKVEVADLDSNRDAALADRDAVAADLINLTATAKELEAALCYAEEVGGDALCERLSIYRQGWADALAD